MNDQKPLLKKISALKNLPTLPHILLKLIDACNQDKGSLKEVSRIAEKDPSLTGKILRMVNSTYYGLPHKVGNMEQAVALVGTNAVKNIAICASVYEAFNQPKRDGIFNLKLFWWHSLKCGVLARLIANKIDYSYPDEAFLSGLLHDIGKLVLWVNFPEPYENLLEVHKDRYDLFLAGEERLGASHNEVGAWLLRRWNLPSFMADSVRYHHELKERVSNALPLVQIVYAANALCRQPIQSQEEGIEITKEIFGFDASDVEQLLFRSEEELNQVAQSLKIEIEPPKDPGAPFSEGDLKRQEDLIQEVRNFSLLQGTLENLLGADDQEAIMEVVEQGLRILFDVKNFFFFLFDPEKEALISTPAVKNKQVVPELEGLILPLKMDKSLVVTSFQQGEPLDTFSLPKDSQPVIVDEQIIRFLGNEGIFCLPLVAHKEHVGVIVLGLDETEFSHFSKNFKLLVMFTNQAASALHVSRLRQNRLQTIQSERVGASAEIARKVFHEVNNPLSIIKNYLTILGRKLSKEQIANEEITIINEEIDRVSQTLRQLATFSEREVLKNEPVDMNTLLSDLVRITKKSLPEETGIKFHTSLDPSLPPVLAKTNELKQVFMNLLKNAVEALVGGGNLYIETRHVSNILGGSPERQGEEYQGYVEIIVKDDGVGIPNEITSRLFEPFVSSKAGEHSGLGLSIVHSIIKALNGRIVCESSKEKGTVFRIELPTVTNRKD